MMMFDWGAFYTGLTVFAAVLGAVGLVLATFFAFEKHWVLGTVTAAGCILMIAMAAGTIVGLQWQ